MAGEQRLAAGRAWRCGIRLIFLDHPLQRRYQYQVIKAMLGHAYLNVDALAQLHGAIALGKNVITAIVRAIVARHLRFDGATGRLVE
jgi:hypothetical protein